MPTPPTNPAPDVLETNVRVTPATLATPQLQRAYCLLLARTLWPTISVADALRVAQWMMNGASGATA